MSALVDGVSISGDMTWIYQALHTSLAASFTLGLYDWFLTFGDEWEYIWRNPKLHMQIKILFSVLRYVALGAQLGFFAWDSSFVSMYPVSPHICRGYRISSVLSLLIQLNAIDCLMILRVWLVFNRGRRFLLILMVTFACQLCIAVIAIIGLLSDLNLDGLCTAVVVPLLSNALFWAAGFIIHTISWVFTMYQCHKARRRKFGKTPLVRLLEQDGTYCWLCFAVTLVLGITLSHKISTALAPMIDPWIFCQSSVLGCRMIINMQRLAYEETTPDEIELCSSVILTTHILPYASGSTWSRVDGQLVDEFVNSQSPESPKTDKFM